MILTVDECRNYIQAFHDTPELLEWLDAAAEDEVSAERRYWLRELRTHLDGLYVLARSLDVHLFPKEAE